MNSKIKELQNKKKEIDAQIAEIRKYHYKTQLEGYIAGGFSEDFVWSASCEENMHISFHPKDRYNDKIDDLFKLLENENRVILADIDGISVKLCTDPDYETIWIPLFVDRSIEKLKRLIKALKLKIENHDAVVEKEKLMQEKQNIEKRIKNYDSYAYDIKKRLGL